MLLRHAVLIFQIPIYVGADRSLLGNNLTTVFHGKDGFGDVNVQSEGDVHLTTPEDTDLTSSSEHAALALWKYASAYPSKEWLRKRPIKVIK
jgi:inosine-uridine nucleoside N-ribohydrolase